jgi:hypothetical protein
MRLVAGALSLLIIVISATPSAAIRRHRSEHPFFARTAVSGYFGAGVAVGEFSSEKDGDGNHESGAFDWSAELEHFFAPGVSVGLNISHTSYDDKDFGGDLQTNIRIFGGFLRYVIETPGPVYPFLRLGVGSMEVEFEDAVSRVESDHSGSLHAGGGAVAMIGDYVSLNASVGYTFGFTDDAVVGDVVVLEDEEVVQVVGFDVQYWTFAAGVSVYFP